jgi:hypothetical protein
MSEARFMIGAGDGSERGPFTKAELRWLWRRNQIDDTTRLRAENADVWIAARSMATELEAAGEETEVLAPEPEPPVVPAVVLNVPGGSGGPALPAKGRPVLQAVQVVSLKLPFWDVLVLTLQFFAAWLILMFLVLPVGFLLFLAAAAMLAGAVTR